ncbi:MAG: methyltransferase domain-containing protein [Thermodesulfobacteriota bacterium]
MTALSFHFICSRLRPALSLAAAMGLLIAVISCAASNQISEPEFTRKSGVEFAKESQKLDVPYVVTHQAVVRAMLDLAAVRPEDYLIDLGSGDGRINIIAAKSYGARGFGVDLNAKLVELSRQYALQAGIADRVAFYVKDLFLTDIGAADVVTMYLLPEVNLKLRPKLLKELKPGARVVSQDFHMEAWRPDDIRIVKDEKGEDRFLYLWFVPAAVGGRWQWQIPILSDDQSFVLEINQDFQNIGGTALNQNIQWRIFNASLTGDQIRFSVISEADDRMVRQDYQGRVKGNIIEGTVRLGGTIAPEVLKWQAERLNG